MAEVAGLGGIVVLLLPLLGAPVNDMASLIDPADYFQTRGVEVKADKMLELAARDPTDGKAQIGQLLALRWLAQHPTEAKKADKAREILASLADGKKAQDGYGFAKEYAQKALAKLDGKPAPAPRKVPVDSVRSDALKWFPAQATILGAMELRASGEVAALDDNAVSSLLVQVIPPRERQMAYDVADMLGNVRLDRIAMSLEFDAGKSEPERIYFRFTGAGDAKRLADFIAKEYPTRKERKGPKGEAITVLGKEGRAPVFAFVGDADLLMVGYQEEKANHMELLEKALDVRAGKAKSATEGTFAEVLKKASDHAQGLLVADVPEAVQRETLRQFPIKVVPSRVVAETTRTKTFNGRFEATFKDADQAKAFVQAVNQLRDQARKAMKDLPPELQKVQKALGPDGEKVLKMLDKVVADVRVEARGAVVSGTMELPGEAAQLIYKLAETAAKLAPKPPER
jgi:hypothetical protein